MDRPVKRNSWIASDPKISAFQRSVSCPSRRWRPPNARPRARPMMMALSSVIRQLHDGALRRARGDVFEHQLDKRRAHHRMPLSSESLLERVQRAPHRHGLPIRTVGAHRVEGVGNRHDRRADRQLGAADAVWIALTVVPLVMSANQPCHLLEVGILSQNVIPNLAVLAHQLHLSVGKGAGLEEDAVANGNLAQIMQLPRYGDLPDFVW